MEVHNEIPSSDLDMDEILDAIFTTHHHDFRRYSRSFLRRRLARIQSVAGWAGREAMERAVREPEAFSILIRELALSVTDFFRDPEVFRSIRENVVPRLATYPSLTCWVAGCGTGEEAYSVAILLSEAGLLERCRIYATDINPESLRFAEAGLYSYEQLRKFSEQYFLAGGTRSPADYYSATQGYGAFHAELKKRIVFADHSLATDTSFVEAELVTCRNVLIYFDRDLQDRALDLIGQSLCRGGFLALGATETVAFSRHAEAFSSFDTEHRIYRHDGLAAQNRCPRKAWPFHLSTTE